MPNDLENQVKLTRRTSQNLRHRLARKAAAVGDRLVGAALGEVDMTPAQVTAAKIVLDKTVPSLASVDSTITHEAPSMTEEQAVARLGELLTKHPELAAILTRRKGTTVDAVQDALPVDQ